MLEEVTDLFADSADETSESEKGLFSDIMERVVVDVEKQVRRDLSQRLAALDNAPVGIVKQLANDDIEVAAPILSQSTVLKDQDLLDVILQRSQEHLLAVTKRAHVSETVSGALVEKGDDKVLVSLASNEGAEISRESMETLVERSEANAALQEPLISRNDLPPDLMNEMFFWVSSALRQTILNTSDMDESLIDNLIDQARSTFKSEMIEEDPDATYAEKVVRRRKKLGQLNEKFLVQSLREGNDKIFACAFADMAGLDPKTARRVLNDSGRETLAIACKASGFDRTTFSTIVLKLNDDQPKKSSEIADLISLYDQVPEQAASRTMRFWRVRQQGLRGRSSPPAGDAPATPQ